MDGTLAMIGDEGADNRANSMGFPPEFSACVRGGGGYASVSSAWIVRVQALM